MGIDGIMNIMNNVDANTMEMWGWIVAILMMTIPPLIVYLFLTIVEPEMPYKRSVGFYIGWIPSNIIACWYLHYTVGWFDAFMLFLFTQIVQLVFVVTMASLTIKWFGEGMFRD